LSVSDLLDDTLRLRQAGAVVFDCQSKGDPGHACSRFVGRFGHVVFGTFLLHLKLQRKKRAIE